MTAGQCEAEHFSLSYDEWNVQYDARVYIYEKYPVCVSLGTSFLSSTQITFGDLSRLVRYLHRIIFSCFVPIYGVNAELCARFCSRYNDLSR